MVVLTSAVLLPMLTAMANSHMCWRMYMSMKSRCKHVQLVNAGATCTIPAPCTLPMAHRPRQVGQQHHVGKRHRRLQRRKQFCDQCSNIVIELFGEVETPLLIGEEEPAAAAAHASGHFEPAAICHSKCDGTAQRDSSKDELSSTSHADSGGSGGGSSSDSSDGGDPVVKCRIIVNEATCSAFICMYAAEEGDYSRYPLPLRNQPTVAAASPASAPAAGAADAASTSPPLPAPAPGAASKPDVGAAEQEAPALAARAVPAAAADPAEMMPVAVASAPAALPAGAPPDVTAAWAGAAAAAASAAIAHVSGSPPRSSTCSTAPSTPTASCDHATVVDLACSGGSVSTGAASPCASTGSGGSTGKYRIKRAAWPASTGDSGHQRVHRVSSSRASSFSDRWEKLRRRLHLSGDLHEPAAAAAASAALAAVGGEAGAEVLCSPRPARVMHALGRMCAHGF